MHLVKNTADLVVLFRRGLWCCDVNSEQLGELDSGITAYLACRLTPNSRKLHPEPTCTLHRSSALYSALEANTHIATTDTRTHAQTYTHSCCARAHILTHTYTHACTNAPTRSDHTHTRARMRAHAHSHTDIQTYGYAHARTFPCLYKKRRLSFLHKPLIQARAVTREWLSWRQHHTARHHQHQSGQGWHAISTRHKKTQTNTINTSQ